MGIPLLIAAAVYFALVGPKVVPAKGGDCDAAAAGASAQGAAIPEWKGWFTVAVLLGTVGAMIGADYFKCLPPMHITACVGAIAVVLFGVLKQKEAFAAFDMQAVFLLSFMTPLGGAMMKTGAAQKIADAVVSVGGGHGPLVMMAVLWLTVWGLTQVMSNMRAVLPDRLDDRQDARRRSEGGRDSHPHSVVGGGLHASGNPGELDDPGAGGIAFQGLL